MQYPVLIQQVRHFKATGQHRLHRPRLIRSKLVIRILEQLQEGIMATDVINKSSVRQIFIMVLLAPCLLISADQVSFINAKTTTKIIIILLL